MSEDIKFCKDCKYYRLSLTDRIFGLKQYGECTKFAKLGSEIDYIVSGDKTKAQYWPASVNRSANCGREAHYFEPKEKTRRSSISWLGLK